MTGGWLPVLMYHRVVERVPAGDPFANCISASAFESQLRWLRRRGRRTISMQRLWRVLGGGEPADPRSLILTFDDGYEDTHRVAWPLLRRYGFSATVFVVTSALDADNRFDSDATGEAVPMLTSAQVTELHAAGIEVGSHSQTHPPDMRALASGELESELAGSRRFLENLVQAPVEHFSYPRTRVDRRVADLVQAAGYRTACAGVGVYFDALRVCRVESLAPGWRLERSIQVRAIKHRGARLLGRSHW